MASAELTSSGAYEKKRLYYIDTDAAVLAAAGTLWGALLTAPSADADLVLYDDPDSADGEAMLTLAALNGTSVFVNLSDFGGKGAATGIYADITGSGAIAYVWFTPAE